MKRIDKLTQTQTEQMDAWADKWIEIGLRTGKADRQLFQESARKCYEFAGIPWHGNVVWVPSPIVMALGAPIAGHLIGVIRKVKGGAAGDAVDGAVSGAVSGAVRDAVRGAVDGAVRDAVTILPQAIRKNYPKYLYGQFWPGGWYLGAAFTSFFRDVCGLELKGDLWERAKAYEGTIQSACLWYPHADFIMVCERPSVIHRELSNPTVTRGSGSHRLHCPNGPAVAWDGWGVYSWHGVLIPGEWVEGKPPTAAKALNWPNIEQRRAACEILGWAKILEQLKAKVIDKDPDEEIGTLLEVNLPGSGKERFLSVKCGTGRRFVIPVEKSCKTARQANAWTWGLGAKDYQPEVRT